MKLTNRLRNSLTAALLARDAVAISALRSAMGAIGNAEAVHGSEGDAPRDGAIELSRTGVGVADVARRELSDGDVVRIVETEISERRSAATDYECRGRHQVAARLRAEADVLGAQLDAIT